MDPQAISAALLASIGSDNTLRQEAYNYLESIKHCPGFISCLMHLIVQDTNSQVSQLSVIFLKNLSKCWDSETWREEDKILIKNNLLQFLHLSTPDKIRLQFEEIAGFIYKSEVPTKDLFVLIDSALRKEESLYPGLSVLYHVSKNYEYTTSAQKRAVLVELSESFMPILIDILIKLLENGSLQAYQYIQVILNIYWVTFYFEVPLNLSTAEALQKWLSCFKVVLEASSIVPDLNPIDAENNSQWVSKKTAAQIVFRYFSRYFTRTYLKENNLFICEYFQTYWAVPFFKLFVNSVFNQKNQFLTDPVLNFYLKYINQGLKFEPVVRELRQDFAGRILVQVCLPLLQIKDSDKELWSEDPIEFIRKGEDEIKAYYSKKTSSISLILSICEKGYLQPFFNYLKTEIEKATDWARKDCLYLALGSINDLIKKNSDRINEDIQAVFNTHLIQDYLSDNHFFKYRCAWLFSKFAQIPFASTALYEQVLKRTCQLMVDQDLPVRYSACLALSRFLSWDICKSMLAGEIKNILTIYLKLIDEIDSEEVIESLESIISVFPNEMSPFACELTQILVMNFEKYTQDTKEDNNLPAYSTLNAILKIVEIISSNQELLIKIGILLLETLKKLVVMKDYTEEFCNILAGLLYNTQSNVLVEIYPLFEMIWIAILGPSGTGDDPLLDTSNCEDIFPCLANFITKFPEKTIENLEAIVVNTCKFLDIDEDLTFMACQIFLVLLENFKLEKMKALIPQIICQVSNIFTLDLSKKYKISCCQVVFTCIWNSADVAIQYYSFVKPLIEYSCVNTKHFSEYLSKIHMILGIGSLFTLTEIPEVVQVDLVRYFKALIFVTADSKIEEIDNEELKNIHKIDINFNYNTTDDCSDEDDYEDYPYGIEPVNNYTFNFESQDPSDAFKLFLDYLKGKKEFNVLFASLNATDEKLLKIIISDN